MDGIQIDGDSSKGISMKKSQELVESQGYTEQNNRKRATMGIVARFLLITLMLPSSLLELGQNDGQSKRLYRLAKLLSFDYSQWFLPRSV